METFSALLALWAGNSPVPVNSPHKGQWRGALMFSLICAWINDWVSNREAGDLRRNRGHYDVNVMFWRARETLVKHAHPAVIMPATLNTFTRNTFPVGFPVMFCGRNQIMVKLIPEIIFIHLPEYRDRILDMVARSLTPQLQLNLFLTPGIPRKVWRPISSEAPWIKFAGNGSWVMLFRSSLYPVPTIYVKTLSRVTP